METIQFIYGNFRYLIFQTDGQYYMLDRRPNHLVGYLVMPLNCIFYQKVYPITESDYLSIKQRNDKFKHIVVPASLGSGLAVFIGSWSRMVNLSFVNHFSKEITVLLLVIILILSYISVQFIYYSRKKSILSLLQNDLTQPVYYKIKPIKFDYKRFIAYIIIMLGLPICLAFIYLYSKDMLFLFAFYIMSLISLLCVNLAFSAEANYFYKIVDIKKEK